MNWSTTLTTAVASIEASICCWLRYFRPFVWCLIVRTISYLCVMLMVVEWILIPIMHDKLYVCAFNVSAFGWLGHVFYGFYLVCLHRKKTPLFAKRLPHFLGKIKLTILVCTFFFRFQILVHLKLFIRIFFLSPTNNSCASPVKKFENSNHFGFR